MDKKQRKRRIISVCFVLVCGVVYLGMHLKTHDRGQLVLERQVADKEGVAVIEVPDGQKTDTAGVAAAEAPDGQKADSAGVASEKAATQSGLLYVHVCGAVIAEGVYSLPDGSRLIDGITAAGGFAGDADTTYHNLAELLYDGQKVYIPTREETEGMSVWEREKQIEDRTVAGTGLQPENGEVCGKVNINTAEAEELMTLSGIGKAKAESIIQYREKAGPFQSIEELRNVSGIGEAMLERVKDNIVVE